MFRKTWFLVGDAARAQVYVREEPDPQILPVNTHSFAAPTRNRSSTAGTDRPGVGRDRVGFGRHAMEPEMDWQTHEKLMFAKRLGRELKAGADSHAYDDLVVVAPPWMLGRLRESLDAVTRRMVRAEIPKDLTHLAMHEVSRRLMQETV